MKRLLPDTIFARLFLLVLAAVVVSELVMMLLFLLHGHGPGHYGALPPLPMPPGGHFGGPPPEVPPRWRGLWVGISVHFVAFVIAAWVGARWVARPIQELAQAASRLGENLDSPPMRETGPAETRAAAQVFNGMQHRIRAQIEERARFLAAVSHDLRTPLTRLRLRVAHLTDEFSRDKMSGDIDEMAAMLDATLNYLRGEAQTEPWQQLDVQALVESLVEDARDHGGDAVAEGSAAPLRAQPLALRRCLGNLLDNALQYGGRAEVSIQDSAEAVLIEVRDHGPGIPENRMAQVFEPFVRLESSRNRNTGGVGLGLAIARDAARRCGGELSLRNAQDGGLIARLWLPRRS